MTTRIAAALLATSLCLPAFAGEVPTAEQFPSVQQKKAMSAQHWQVIAADTSRAVLQDLGNHAERGVYVHVPEGAPVFARQLASFLADSFYRAGIPVRSRPSGQTLVVELHTGVAAYASRALPEPNLKWTALTAGVMVLREIALSSTPAALLFGAVGLDIATTPSKHAPRSELIVSASVEDKGLFLSRQSAVYYIEGADVGLLGGFAYDAATDYRMFRIVKE